MFRICNDDNSAVVEDNLSIVADNSTFSTECVNYR